ncbi:GntR family transcriptional regulator [Afipia carboxidovorans]|uniref:GntR family transcriptional regulator n=1 Tax=Afipia carboxidovorans TaxID=40137 RepID=UPI00187333C3|nr:GntR family transcriptional regulator [Afipia carboxidovorans]
MERVKPLAHRAPLSKPAPELVVGRFAPEQTFKTRAYEALKQAILDMDIYASSEPAWIDERQLSEQLGVSRTPVREAIVMLEHEGLVKSVPRKGVMVLKKTKREVIDMIQAWAALESMAARLATLHASDESIAGLRRLFRGFDDAHKPADHLSEYSSANILFHQTIVKLSGSQVLVDMTEQVLLHVRGLRQITIGRDDRASRSIIDHLAIIDAIEKRDTERAVRLSRDHTLGLADYVAAHSDGIFE